MARHDPARGERVAAMVQQGHSNRDIAATLGVSSKCVSIWRRRVGMGASSGFGAWSAQEDAQLRALAAAGLNNAAIAQRLQRTASAVKNRRAKLLRREAEPAAVPAPAPQAAPAPLPYPMVVRPSPQDAIRRRVESQVARGVPRRDAETEAMRWHERRRGA